MTARGRGFLINSRAPLREGGPQKRTGHPANGMVWHGGKYVWGKVRYHRGDGKLWYGELKSRTIHRCKFVFLHSIIFARL